MKNETITAKTFEDAHLYGGVDHKSGSVDLSEVIELLQGLDQSLKNMGEGEATKLSTRAWEAKLEVSCVLDTVQETLFARTMTELADCGRGKEALAYMKNTGVKNGIQTKALQEIEKSVRS